MISLWQISFNVYYLLLSFSGGLVQYNFIKPVEQLNIDYMQKRGEKKAKIINFYPFAGAW
ncbi:hypothetical protein DCCM_4269 [Desulfocucumis palustris]|uniref:Uncharacterized protein n=1 Tax=Desulfocucumis palustris TaxID=1898651 RepID=A0A2L2XLH5_9FIRM|nr:hypothetical protein DCCM_4269 [Desulfocucumis palustris]